MYEVLIDFKGSPDGCRVIQFEKGQTLTIGDDFSQDLCEVALAEDWVTKYMIDPGPSQAKKSKKTKK